MNDNSTRPLQSNKIANWREMLKLALEPSQIHNVVIECFELLPASVFKNPLDNSKGEPRICSANYYKEKLVLISFNKTIGR